jgi:hypothetical protein
MTEQVTCDSDVAYATIQMADNQQPLTPKPLLPWTKKYTYTVKNSAGQKMFETTAKATFVFIFIIFLINIIPDSSQYVYPAFRWRYTTQFPYIFTEEEYHGDWGRENAWGFFHDGVLKTNPQIYAWVECSFDGQAWGGGVYYPNPHI